MTRSVSRCPQRSYLLDVAELRDQLEPLLNQLPDSPLRTALLQVHILLQALLAEAEPRGLTNGTGPVVLHRFGFPVLVRGREKPPLTYPQFQVVRALVAAGESGLTKGDLEGVNSDARGILRRLCAADADWRAVIHFAGRRGLRYRIG